MNTFISFDGIRINIPIRKFILRWRPESYFLDLETSGQRLLSNERAAARNRHFGAGMAGSPCKNGAMVLDMPKLLT